MSLGPCHLLLHGLLPELLQILKVLLDIPVILREQRVEHDLPSAHVDGCAQVLFQLPARRLQIPLMVVTGTRLPTRKEEVPDVAFLELGQVGETGSQDVRDAAELLVDVFEVVHGEESCPARLGVPAGGHLGVAPLPLQCPVVAGDGELTLDDVPLDDESQLERLGLLEYVALDGHPALQAVQPLALDVIHAKKRKGPVGHLVAAASVYNVRHLRDVSCLQVRLKLPKLSINGTIAVFGDG